jgi:hypothetical protein
MHWANITYAIFTHSIWPIACIWKNITLFKLLNYRLTVRSSTQWCTWWCKPKWSTDLQSTCPKAFSRGNEPEVIIFDPQSWNLCLSASAAIHEPQVLVNFVILLRRHSLLIGSMVVMGARYVVCCIGVGRYDCCASNMRVIENNKNDTYQRGISQNGEAICKFQNNRFRVRTGCCEARMS